MSDGERESADIVEDAPRAETRGQMERRHHAEMKALKLKTTQMQNKASKADKKAVKKEVQDLETALEQKHATELQALVAGSAPVVEEVPVAAATPIEEREARPTKSQQKKNKKAAAAEARRAEVEKEAAGAVNKREVELEKLGVILRPLNLQILQIKPDGHCLYRALAEQSGGDFLDLRRQTAAYLREHRDDLMPFIETCENESDYEHYCQKVESTAEWGGQVELQALVHVLRRPVEVYNADGPRVDMGQEYTGQVPCRVSYHLHDYGLGEHYNAVVPRLAEDEAGPDS